MKKYLFLLMFAIVASEYLWAQEIIPTTAPPTPIQNEERVMAIYCNTYKTNNLNFNIMGWGSTWSTLTINGTDVCYTSNMTWDCLANYDVNSRDLRGFETIHFDVWVPQASQIGLTMEDQEDASSSPANKVCVCFNLEKGWNSIDANIEQWGINWKKFHIFTFEKYRLVDGTSAEGNPFAFANIYFWRSSSNPTFPCGNNVQASWDGKSILTIDGIGAMINYQSYDDAPWYPIRNNIKTVVIKDGITSIGNYAFYDCDSLTSVNIGNSVTSIGDYAFYDCNISSITIPNSVTSIGVGAFYSCTSLTSITIPYSVTSIGDYAFYDCNILTSIHVAIDNPTYCSVDGVLFNKDKTILMTYPRGKQGVYEIPNSVTSIGDIAFEGCTGLTSVIIPNSVTSIGNCAFFGCIGLTSVTMEVITPPVVIPDKWGRPQFCGCDALNAIYVPCGTLETYKSAEEWSNYALKIKYKPFPYVLTIKSENGSIIHSQLETICDAPFVTCTATPDRGYYFVKWADGNTDNPHTIELTQDITMEAIFAPYTKGKCGNNLTWTYSNSCLNIHGSGAMWNDEFEETWYASREKITIINLPPNITSIGNGAFAGCTNLTSINIPNAVTSIGQCAFCECNNLKDVMLGSSVKVLEEAAFYECSAIETITSYSQRPPTVNNYALYGLDYSTIVYVPADYLNTYVMHDAWGLYDVRPIGAATTQTSDLKIEPYETTADVSWPSVQGAYTYELTIKDKQGNIVCTLVFNEQGQLTSIAFHAHSRNHVPELVQQAGFTFTVTGLDNGSCYSLTINAKDSEGKVLKTYAQDFTTNGVTAIDDLFASYSLDEVLANPNTRIYTLQGMEVSSIRKLLPQGIYILRLEDKVGKAVIR